VRNARRDYRKLMMRSTEKFTDFYTRFLHLASEGQIPDEDLRLDLYDKLTLELQRAIALMEGTLHTQGFAESPAPPRPKSLSHS
jgi:hypothetical protein